MNKLFFAEHATNTFLSLSLTLMIVAVGAGCKKHDHPSQPVKEKKWVVTTIAGDGTAAFGNGPALTAKFNAPADVAVAKDGSIYVTDSHNYLIRKIANKQVTTFAGSDSGFVDGVGTAAKFKGPYMITLDANENLYLSDIYSRSLRKISPAAEVTTFTPTDTDVFNYAESGIATDAQGNLFISDTYHHHIRKVSVSGNVIDYAGNDTSGFRNGRGNAAWFNYPTGIAVDPQGNAYVADLLNARIRKINPEGVVSTFAGINKFGDDDGDLATASFFYPRDIVIDKDGNLYVADEFRIRKISTQGIVTTIAGGDEGYEDGDGPAAKFRFISGIAIDAQGNIYIADANNNRVRKLSFE